jgi:hypothetical protein
VLVVATRAFGPTVGAQEFGASSMNVDPYLYRFMSGATSRWQPNLFRNTTAIYPHTDFVR